MIDVASTPPFFPSASVMPSESGTDPEALAFQREVTDPAVDEVTAAIGDLLRDAIARRLPWTWDEGDPVASGD